MKRSVTQLSADHRMQALLIAFSFGAFLEGAAGFGAPVAISAALLAGAGLGLGLIDRAEARRWEQAENDRGSRLFLMIRPGAMLVRMGTSECFELPQATLPDDGPSPFDLP
jgi:hypothetical protein